MASLAAVCCWSLVLVFGGSLATGYGRRRVALPRVASCKPGRPRSYSNGPWPTPPRRRIPCLRGRFSVGASRVDRVEDAEFIVACLEVLPGHYGTEGRGMRAPRSDARFDGVISP